MPDFEPLHLHLNDPNLIALPISLVGSDFTLAEIGALFCLMAIPSLNFEDPNIEERFASSEMRYAGNLLQQRGIFSSQTDGDQVTIKINLEAIGL